MVTRMWEGVRELLFAVDSFEFYVASEHPYWELGRRPRNFDVMNGRKFLTL